MTSENSERTCLNRTAIEVGRPLSGSIADVVSVPNTAPKVDACSTRTQWVVDGADTKALSTQGQGPSLPQRRRAPLYEAPPAASAIYSAGMTYKTTFAMMPALLLVLPLLYSQLE